MIILGGGPSGTAAALSLRANAPRLRVAVIEQSAYGAARIGETLPPIVQPLLRQLGVWEAFVAEGHLQSYGASSAWGSDELSDNEFIFHTEGRGWHLDRRRFDVMLASEAEARGATLYLGARILDTQRTPAGDWRFDVRNREGETISVAARFVVDATGRRAAFAALQGAKRVLFDRLLGVSVFFACVSSASADTYSVVEAFEEGWWYTALLPGRGLVAVLMTDADIVRKERLRSSPAWFERLGRTHHIGARCADAASHTEPSVHVAASARLDPLTGDDWLATGDAASTFDPLSSQGVFKALRHGILASYAVCDYFKGVRAGLEKYAALVAGEFEEYLGTRREFYRAEARWPHAPFWQRRHAHISLHPAQKLLLARGVVPERVERAPMHLPAPELRLLCQLCAEPRTAHEIVAAFKAQTRSSLPDRRIIIALQTLVEGGLIAKHAS
ncbi:MAG TPA: tryptophan 7-halogenase [Pyrinomonadaceae bacterium]|nr:tryptophan 7-halogenase [Pyrinomonadaceae bacterium]